VGSHTSTVTTWGEIRCFWYSDSGHNTVVTLCKYCGTSNEQEIDCHENPFELAEVRHSPTCRMVTAVAERTVAHLFSEAPVGAEAHHCKSFWLRLKHLWRALVDLFRG
jgi:hypothetical protein